MKEELLWMRVMIGIINLMIIQIIILTTTSIAISIILIITIMSIVFILQPIFLIITILKLTSINFYQYHCHRGCYSNYFKSSDCKICYF